MISELQDSNIIRTGNFYAIFLSKSLLQFDNTAINLYTLQIICPARKIPT